MGRSRSLTRLGSLIKRAATGASESQAAAGSTIASDAAFVSKRTFASAPFRSNTLGGQCTAIDLAICFARAIFWRRSLGQPMSSRVVPSFS